MRHFLLAAALTAIAMPASAVETSMQLVLTLEGNAQRDVITYECDGIEAPLTVEYVNAHPIFLALVPIEEESLVFVDVIVASGQWVWWTQGNEAQLIDETADEDAESIACHSAEDIP
jgi:membrane-bound inhibitor of C-type lysozyme